MKIRNRIIGLILGMIVAATTLIGGATSASAVTGKCYGTQLADKELKMCQVAVSLANFTPLNGRGVVNLGYRWCDHYNFYRYGAVKHTYAQSLTYANQRMNSEVGTTKSTALFGSTANVLCAYK